MASGIEIMNDNYDIYMYKSYKTENQYTYISQLFNPIDSLLTILSLFQTEPYYL